MDKRNIGRNSLPSKATIDALAKVLKLNEVERAHILRLSQGNSGREFKKESVPKWVAKLVQELPTPAYVIGARYDILCFNKAVTELFPGFATSSSTLEMNLLYKMFANPKIVRKIFINWEKDARDILESFKGIFDLWAHAPEFVELIEKTSSINPEFKRW